jgi:SAM-dependent methyltransferase
MEWSRGYFASTEYTYGYYTETMPSRLAFAALLCGVITRRERFRYLDLGCGQGLNLLIAAALHPDSEFVGVDFMPEHICHAQRLAAQAGITNVTFLEADFVALAADLSPLGGGFDYAVAHGITTWISSEARAALYTVAAQSLVPNGVFYNSYNTMPGWLSVVPFQHMVLHQFKTSSGADALATSRSLFEQLRAANAPLFSALPALSARLDKLSELDASYLLQEYNNKHWQPAWVDKVMLELANHKLTYLGTSTITEAFDQNYPQALRDKFLAFKDPSTRELVRDISVNQAFRRDLYIKGKARTWPGALAAALKSTKLSVNVFRALPAEEELFVFSTGTLEVKGLREAYLKLIQCALKPKTDFIDIDTLSAQSGVSFVETVQMAALLVHGGWFGLAPTHVKDSADSAKRFNETLLQQALLGAPYRFLASPLTGAAVSAAEIDILMLATRDKAAEPHNQALLVRNALNTLGRALLKEGKPVTNEAEANEMLLRQLTIFSKGLDTWKKMKVI